MQVSGDKGHRVVIVTGASRGIGVAIARLVGSNGFPVAVNVVSDKSDADQVVREIESDGGRAVAIHGDVSREEEILQLFLERTRACGTASSSRERSPVNHCNDAVQITFQRRPS